MTSMSAAPRSKKIGKKKWNRRVARVIDVLRTVVAFDHLYIGGGNAKHLKFDLPDDVSIVPNSFRADRRVRAVARHRCGAAGARPQRFPAISRTATAAMPRTPVGFDVPEDACDCHVHVFGTAAQFPFADRRSYTPPPASADALSALLRALHLSRVVIVQPSVYGTDNSCTLDGMRRLGPARARGVAVIGEAISDAELDAMHRAGIRGIRVNLETAGESDPDLARRLLGGRGGAGRGAGLACPGLYAARGDRGLERGGRAPAGAGRLRSFRRRAGCRRRRSSPDFRRCSIWSGPGMPMSKYRPRIAARNAAPAYADVAPLARALIDANPERVLWGSDWPHPHAAAPGSERDALTPFYDIDDGLALNQLALGARRGDAPQDSGRESGATLRLLSA